jgi:transcriptional regulator with XRE-family HTH domain
MKDALKGEIGRRLERIRKNLGLNQRRMAARLNLADISYSRIERGLFYPSAITLHQLSSRLNVSLDWLFCGQGNMFIGKKETGKTGLEKAKSSNKFERDVEEMVYLMGHIPLVHYSMMDHFQRFKLENRIAIDEELKKIAGTKKVEE